MCAWICDTGAQLALLSGGQEQQSAYLRLADRFRYGCSDGALFLARFPHRIRRTDRERFAAAGLDTLDKIVRMPSQEIAHRTSIPLTHIGALQEKIRIHNSSKG